MIDKQEWRIMPIRMLHFSGLATYPSGRITIMNFEAGSTWKLSPIFDQDDYGTDRAVAYEFIGKFIIIQNNFEDYQAFWDDITNENYNNWLRIDLGSTLNQINKGNMQVGFYFSTPDYKWKISVEFEQKGTSPTATINLIGIFTKDIFKNRFFKQTTDSNNFQQFL